MNEILNLAGQVISILGMLAAGSVGVYASTHTAKKLTNLRASLDNVMVKRGMAGLFSVLAVIVISFLGDGEVKPENVQELMIQVIEVASVWFSSHKVHEAVKG